MDEERTRLRLREIAMERGLNISALQRQSGLTIGQIRRYWHNEVDAVSLRALSLLAKILEVEPGELIVSGIKPPEAKR